MKITQDDLNEVPVLARLSIVVDHIDTDYVNEVSDEIFQKQPFFLTVLLGYRLDTTPVELEEIMKIYFLVWEYFRTNEKVQAVKVTREYFETIEDRNIAMLQYTDGELDEVEKMNIYSADLSNLKSKALFTAILLRCNTRPILRTMDERKRGLILLGVKSFIECFERL